MAQNELLSDIDFGNLGGDMAGVDLEGLNAQDIAAASLAQRVQRLEAALQLTSGRMSSGVVDGDELRLHRGKHPPIETIEVAIPNNMGAGAQSANNLPQPRPAMRNRRLSELFVTFSDNLDGVIQQLELTIIHDGDETGMEALPADLTFHGLNGPRPITLTERGDNGPIKVSFGSVEQIDYIVDNVGDPLNLNNDGAVFFHHVFAG